MEEHALLWLYIWLTFPFARMLAGWTREAALEGFMAGTVLGPVGVIAMLGYDNRSQCDQCRSRHYLDAKICPNCCAPIPEKKAESHF